jgi:hypothetical protein
MYINLIFSESFYINVLKWQVFLASKFGGLFSRVNPAGCYGKLFWRVILADYFGTFIWRVSWPMKQAGFKRKK